jgi:hypothetical protein
MEAIEGSSAQTVIYSVQQTVLSHVKIQFPQIKRILEILKVL